MFPDPMGLTIVDDTVVMAMPDESLKPRRREESSDESTERVSPMPEFETPGNATVAEEADGDEPTRR